VLGQNNQSNLTVGYQYGVVDNNTVVSEDITVFKLGEFDTTGESFKRLLCLKGKGSLPKG